LWGTRQSKYSVLAEGNIESIEWTEVGVAEPDWSFKPRDAKIAKIYYEFMSVTELFSPIGDPAPGIVTTHDEFAISFTKEEAKHKVRQLLESSSESEARDLFRLCSQKQWNYKRAKSELVKLDIDSTLVQILYRPFDLRWTVWDSNAAVHRRERVMQHLLKSNIALITTRQTKGEIFQHAFVTVNAVEVISLSPNTSNNEFIFPLYLYQGSNKVEDISQMARELVDGRYDHHYASEEILGYIYAILNAPTYRTRYRVPSHRLPARAFPEKAEDFERLSRLGWALVEAHLLRNLSRGKLAAYHGKGDHAVEFVHYSEAEQSIAINKTQSFQPVPPAVWNFHIGGYQVLDKYLKSRKGRKLSLDEIDHLAKVADALAFTIGQMAKIDDAYRAAFP
jgi:predicted helicase